MTFACLPLLFALTSADAVAILLNSPNAVKPSVYESAKELVEKDARAGKPLQQFVIGVMTDDAALSARYLAASRGRIEDLAERRGNPLALYLMSVERNDFRLLRRAAEGGNVQALNALGTIAMQEAARRRAWETNSYDGVIVRCRDYFSRAAAKRDANGFVNLGLCYWRGIGGERNPELGFQSFRSAAELGHPEAMDYMAMMYRRGEGVPRDEKLSLYWTMRARAARGDEAAENWLRSGRE